MVQFKNRYLLMEVFIDPNKDLGGNEPIILSQYNLLRVIKDSLLLNFGECGLAVSLRSLQVKYINPVTKLCIVRTSREDYQKVWSAITMVRSIGKCPITFNLLDLSGSMRACKTAAVNCDKAKYEQYKLAAGGFVKPGLAHLAESCLEKLQNLES